MTEVICPGAEKCAFPCATPSPDPALGAMQSLTMPHLCECTNRECLVSRPRIYHRKLRKNAKIIHLGHSRVVK